MSLHQWRIIATSRTENDKLSWALHWSFREIGLTGLKVICSRRQNRQTPWMLLISALMSMLRCLKTAMQCGYRLMRRQMKETALSRGESLTLETETSWAMCCSLVLAVGGHPE